MLGHNWGTEHAERWIWLHGTAFEGDDSAWLDVVIGRVKVAGRTTPWIANGAVSVGGTRHRVRGKARVTEDPLGAHVEVGDLTVEVRSEPDRVVVWRYSDPEPGHEHHTANGSVATLTVDWPTRPAGASTPRTAGSTSWGCESRTTGSRSCPSPIPS